MNFLYNDYLLYLILIYDNYLNFHDNLNDQILNLLIGNNYILFLEHDFNNECCTVQHTEKGVRLKDTFTFNERFG